MTKKPLTPTPIVDKNGVRTTRLKKPMRTAVSRQLPAPLVSKWRSHKEVEASLAKLNYRAGPFADLIAGKIAGLSDENFEVFNALLDAPNTASDLKDDRVQSAAAIIQQSPSKHQWQLYGALVLARGSTMRSTFQLPLLTFLSEDERYAQSIESLHTVGPAFEQQVCNIANGIDKIMETERGLFSKNAFSWEKNEFVRQERNELIFRNPKVVEAMLARPDHAVLVADMFLERGHVDAVDEAIAVSGVFQEGAL